MSKSSLKVNIPFHVVLAEKEFERQRRRDRAEAEFMNIQFR